MAEFIGTRISLVSNSDIRYVGTLHEINSETSTVALENVSMLGTEGRRPDNEVAALDSIYEYILFRGTDVKDLRIEETPAVKENKPPQVPNDPAILGSGMHPKNMIRSQNQPQQITTQTQSQSAILSSQSTQSVPSSGPSYAQHLQYQQFYPPPSGWGRSGHLGPGGYPTTPYGGPPDWYPGQQQGFLPGHQLAPYGYPTGPSNFIPQHQNISNTKPLPIGVSVNKQPTSSNNQAKKVTEKLSALKVIDDPIPPKHIPQGPPAAVKPSSNEATASNSVQKQALAHIADTIKPIPTGPKVDNQIKPVLPLGSISNSKESMKYNSNNVTTSNATVPSVSLREASQTASAAVAAAMARLPNKNSNSILNDEKESSNFVKKSRNPSTPDVAADRINRGAHRARGSRGGTRGGATKVEVPTEDFDFETSNAKFSKQDLIREACAVSPIHGKVVDLPMEKEALISYNKSKSFFDNISSEVKDRLEAGISRPGGREWRGEEQKRNLETFGQESIDNGSRGGHRGRGRGRSGRSGHRARSYTRGQSSRGRFGYRNRGNAPATS